jgi:transcriptional regulator with XRE-family HTH domain
VIEKKEIELIQKVGINVKLFRLSKNLSQETLSFDANIPKNQVGRIERGQINTSIGTLFKICTALNINIKDLFE